MDPTGALFQLGEGARVPIGPVPLGVPGVECHAQQSRKTIKAGKLTPRSDNEYLKEFGVLLVAKNASLRNGLYTYTTHTFNVPTIREWAARNQIPVYLQRIGKGSDSQHKFINKVTAVYIKDNSNIPTANKSTGAATLNWVDSNGDIAISTTGHIW